MHFYIKVDDINEESTIEEDSDENVIEENATGKNAIGENANEENANLKLNESFKSHEELQKRIEEYQNYSNCIFYTRDSMTIERCRKNGVKRPIDENLKYYFLKYNCIHGGRNFKPAGRGERSSSTFQKECPATFHVNVSDDGKRLFISRMDLHHNHLTTKQFTLGKKNQLEAVKNILINDYQADCNFLIEDNIFKGLFFATPQMKSAMEFYPEYIGIDATYKLLNIRAPVYLYIVEDPNGCTKIAGVSILVNEDKPSITWMMNCFKACHPSWKKIKCIMTDKDLTERAAIRDSLFTFGSESDYVEITIEKRNITAKERDEAKRILQEMVYAKTEERYFQLYEELKKMPQSIVEYFDKNWHECRKEWSLSSDYVQHNFGNGTNNRLESLNAKIKIDVDKYLSLEDFVRQLLICTECSQLEKNHKAAKSYQKQKVLSFSKDSPECRYSQYVTNYAFNFIKKELEKMHKLELIYNENLNVYQQNLTPTGIISTTSSSCDCLERTSMILPCRHIFMVRKIENKNLFEESLCDKRWTSDYYYNTQRVFSTVQEEILIPEPVITSTQYKQKVLSENEKYKKSLEVVKKLPALAAEVGTKLFLKRFEVLVNLVEAWQNNQEVVIIKESNKNKQTIHLDPSGPNSPDVTESDSDNQMEDDRDLKDSSIDENLNNSINSDRNEDSDLQETFNDENPHSPNIIVHENPQKEKNDLINSDSNHDGHVQDTFNDKDPDSPNIIIHDIPRTEQISFTSSDSSDVIDARQIKKRRTRNALSNSSDDNNDRAILSQSTGLKENEKYMPNVSTPIEPTKKLSILSNVIVQPALKRRGRPRGTDQTVIGLKKIIKDKKSLKMPFINKSTEDKRKIILQWLVKEEVIT
ncbi:Protein of unknown function, partial [Cotesia congregata]